MTRHSSTAGSEIPAACYPASTNTEPIHLKSVVESWLVSFNDALKLRQHVTLHELFFEDSFWKDQLTLSWDLRTLRGPTSMISFLNSLSMQGKSTRLRLQLSQKHRKPRWEPIDHHGSVKCVTSLLNFETGIGVGHGVLRLMQDATTAAWKAFSLFTATIDLKGYEKAVRHRRPLGRERKVINCERVFQDYDSPAVVILGAGHCGLATAARLRQLGVDCLVVDTEKCIGDNWRQRYGDLVLHDPIWCMTPFPGNYVCINTDIPSVEDNHLPYFPFPDSWPVFIPKDDMADWLKTYAKTMKLDVWTSTYLQETSWKGSHWQLVLVKLLDDGVSEKITLRPRHIIQATGQAGKPHIPRVSGISTFRGSVCHSAHFAGASPCKAAQHAVIVGSGNSAHDIARNYYDQGWKVTMIQRSSTFVDPVQYNSCKGLYREGGLPTEDADLLTQSIPNALLKRVQMEAVSQTRLEHHALFTRLEEQGFKLNWGPEGSGRKLMYLTQGGGYYIDTGTSSLIASGLINVLSGYHISKFTPEGVILQANSTTLGIDSCPIKLAADQVVLCTGYESLHTTTRSIFGDTVADMVGPIWGLDEEGEMRRVWRPSGVRGFWVVGGNFKLARWGSEGLGLLIKALEVGICTWDDLGCR